MFSNHFCYEVKVGFDHMVRDHHFLLRCIPAEDDRQHVVTRAVTVDPAVPLRTWHDGFGNLCCTGSAEEPHDHFSYRSEGDVLVDQEGRLPVPYEQAVIYKSLGEMTRPDSFLRSYASSLVPLIRSLPLENRVVMLCSQVHARITYEKGVTGTGTTAAEAFRLGKGVCQDFSNIAIALCHELDITARYCMGLASESGETHAWIEILFPDGWHGMDPTRGCMADDHYIRIASGRDSGDCPAVTGVMTGAAGQSQKVETRVEGVLLAEGEAESRHWSVQQ